MPSPRSPKKEAKIHSYVVIFEPVAEGGYNVVVPAIPEVCTFGKTLREARRMAMDAISCYLESSAEENAAPPCDIRKAPRIARLAVKLQPV